MMKKGSNNMSGIVWALGEFFKVSIFFSLILTNVYSVYRLNTQQWKAAAAKRGSRDEIAAGEAWDFTMAYHSLLKFQQSIL